MKTLKRHGKRLLSGILVLIVLLGGIGIVPVAAEEAGYITLGENQTYKATVYVSETGRDTAAGTEQAPVLTLLKAYEKLKTAMADATASDVGRIVVRGTVNGMMSKDDIETAAHDYIVHITGENGALSFDTATNCFMGPTIFSDITFENINLGGGVNIFANGPMTIGKNVMTAEEIILVGGGKGNYTRGSWLLVESGSWAEIYSGCYKKSDVLRGNANLKMNGGEVGNIAATYSGQVIGDVSMTFAGTAKVNGSYFSGGARNESSNGISGNSTIVVSENAEIGSKVKIWYDPCGENGTTTLVFRNAANANFAWSYDDENSDVGHLQLEATAEESPLVISCDKTINAKTFVGGGKMTLNGAKLNITDSVTGSTAVSFGGEPKLDTIYITAPAATADDAFICATDGLWLTAAVDGENKTWTLTEKAMPTLYAVMIDDAIENGVVEASSASAAAGTIVTLSAEPASGYELVTLNVMDSEGNAISVEEGTFIMPASNVTISAAFAVVRKPVTGIELDKKNLSLRVGESEKLNAATLPADATDKGVTWSSNNAAVAAVDEGGRVTAVAAGSTTITVTTEDGGYTATCEVTVTQPVTGVELNKDALSLSVGETKTLTATVLPTDATDKGVTWSSNNPAVAAVDENGKVTAVAAGSTTITVTTADGGHIATCEVAVTQPASGVTLDKGNLSLSVGESDTLTATVLPTDATDKGVTWSSNNPAVATADESGRVAAVAVGSAIITVTTADGSHTATCEVTVTQPVAGVALDKDTLSLCVGESETLNATILPTDATNKGVTWSSDNAAVAIVDENGKVTAVAAGSAIITVTTADGSYTATCEVTVTQPTTGVELDKNTLSLRVGESDTLTDSVLPANATNKGVTWSSDNAAVAVVDESGRVTAVAAGNTTVTVTTADGGYTATCEVTVTQPASGVTLNKENLSLRVGESETLTASVLPTDATNKGVTWSSDNAAVAAVDENGKVTAVAAGSATITVTTADGSYTATCEVTVMQPVTGVELDKKNLSLRVGESDTLVATVLPTDATNKGVTWSSDNAAVAAVDESGKVTAVAAGSAIITVTTADGGYTATCEVTVTQPASGVTLDKENLSLRVGESEKLNATILPADATNKGVTWSSDNAAVAAVDETGKVTAFAAGEANITVKTEEGNFTATCAVTVSELTPPSEGDDSNTTTPTDPPPATNIPTVLPVSPGVSQEDPNVVTKTETSADGTIIKTETQKDGTKVETITRLDGSKGTVIVDKTGKIEAEVEVTDKAVTEAVKSGEAVVLPMPKVLAAKSAENASTVSINTPASAGTVKVEVPVENVGGGVVAVIVNADGSETVITETIPAESGIVVPIAGDVKIKIVDKSATFIDVAADDWEKKAVDFNSARGIMNGIGDGTTFAPDAKTTRAMVWTMLARLKGVDTSVGSTWDEIGRNWAVANGISDGTNGDAEITREQLATMLYRFMGSPVHDHEIDHFDDHHETSDWARKGKEWAVGNKVINGKTGDDGKISLDPTDDATRAEVSQMFMNLFVNVGVN